MGITDTINKIAEIIGAPFDPEKQAKLEEMFARQDEAKYNNLATIFEKMGFPTMVWLTCGLVPVFIFYEIFTGHALNLSPFTTEIIKEVVSCVKIGFTALMGKKAVVSYFESKK
ncbi:MAG: hypothetical protein ACRC0V_03830 [Fusobacteriaceae bacterium]